MRISTTSIIAVALSVGFVVGSQTELLRADMRGSGVFPDVERNSYYDDAVGSMYEAGIIGGYDDGRFGPNDPVTRAQVAVMLERFANAIDANLGSVRSSSSSVRSTRSSSSRSSVSSSSSTASTVPGAGELSFSTTGFDIPEASSTATINVSRTGGSEGTVRVKYETIDNEATEGDDYTKATGELVFNDGETSKTITVGIKEDKDGEAAETFTVRLYDPSGGAGLGSVNEISVRILDNDGGAYTSSSSTATTGGQTIPAAGGFHYSAVEYMVDEKDDSITIYVERLGDATGTAGVSYTTAEIDGEADAGDHFQSTNGTLSFADGETSKAFTVSILTDDVTGDQNFKLQLSNPTGGAIIVEAESVVRIRDTDISTFGNGSIGFSEEEYEGSDSLVEGETMPIAIERKLGALGEVTVRVQTQAATAKADQDFTAINKVITFREGEVVKYVYVTAKDDNENDDNESFRLNLSDVTGGATLNSDTSTVIYIDG